jgi:hypothetical protein
VLNETEAMAVAEAVASYHAGDGISADDLEAEIARAINWAVWVRFSGASLDLILADALSITIEEGEREPRLFPRGDSDAITTDDVEDLIFETERFLADPGHANDA